MCDSAATCSNVFCDSELAAQGGPWLLLQGVGFNTQRDLTLGFGGLSSCVGSRHCVPAGPWTGLCH